MSVYFYCTAWAIAKKPEDLDSITNDELLSIAIQPKSSSDEGQAWLTEARRIRAGTIESRARFKMKIYAGESRGHCLYVKELSRLHPDVLFIEISGADSTDEEYIAMIKNGSVIFDYRDVIQYDHKFFQFIKESDDDSTFDKAEQLFSNLYGSIMSDAFLQYDPEE